MSHLQAASRRFNNETDIIKNSSHVALIKELFRLRDLISSNASAYYRAIDKDAEPSDRFYSWIDRYNDIKMLRTDAWTEYCRRSNNAAVDHDAMDLLA
jgi:hypothetical protein